jgi:hypothetical protein
MKLGDKLIILLILLSVIGFIAIQLFDSSQESQRIIEVWFDGELLSTHNLQEQYREILFERNGMRNLIIIEDNGTFIKEANCPTQQCVHQGMVTKNNQSIVCLPHKLIVKVVIQESDEVDTIVR